MHPTGLGERFWAPAIKEPWADWMLFALYYSVRRYLPDASFSFRLDRGGTRDCLRWAYRLDVPRVRGPASGTELPLASVAVCPPGSVNPGVVRACDPDLGVFVDYSDGLVGIPFEKWVHTVSPPFPGAEARFGPTAKTANEAAVLREWDAAAVTYRVVR